MLTISREVELTAKLDAVRREFAELRKDGDFVARIYSAVKSIDSWKYSTGPIFEQPPFIDEMSGFNPGRLLRKSYVDVFEARAKGVYSSGFIGGQPIVTVSPSRSQSAPLAGAFYSYEDTLTRKTTYEIFDSSFTQVSKPSSVNALSHIFFWKDDVLASVGVGRGNASAIWLYYYGADKMITGASMVTAPSNTQSDYEFLYDTTGVLTRVMSDGIVWERK